ncbi:serine/threonine-protein kinase [Nevskia sp.]|uniref:serine/threonine-protein kinase n=1 Tax=Nevskia sp. TaxID=1929292 RepID=UPI0025D88B33|nr:serine/threonine-protein kinase [Nevskia sp.]
MTRAAEQQILAIFEQALDQPASARAAWLAAQDLPEPVLARVQRLLAVEASTDGFLEEAAELPPSLAGPQFPQPGERIGNWELIRELDAGGMGVVFLGRRADEAYEQTVAIKLIRASHLGGGSAFREQLIARFENERTLLARLQHPNIARILDGGSTASGIPYLVMEYVEGQSLIDWCDAQQLDIRARLKVFRKVCDGVQDAHRHLIVHRDLKPENILVGADGEPRLLDFGIARALEDLSTPVGGNATMLTAMTPAYASPEQLRNEPLSTGSDVYSLGVVLYQLLTGRRPYELAGLSPAQTERLVCETEPPGLRAILRSAPIVDAEHARRLAQIAPDLERIVAKALHKDVARRYASAQELADELQRYLDGLPVRAHPDSAAYRTAKFVRRHRIGTAAAAAALIAIVSAAGLAFWQAREARQSAADMQAINGFLLEVLQTGDPFETGSELSLSQALDKAAASIDSRFADRPDLSADIRFGIGYGMVNRYKLDAAERQLLMALDESTKVRGANDIRSLRILDGVAGLRFEQGRLDQAETLYLDTVKRLEAAGLSDDPLYFNALGNLGNLLLAQERYADADPLLQRALAAMPMPLPAAMLTDRANLLNNLAQVAHGLEDYPRADTLYAQAIDILSAKFPNGSPDLSTAVYNRAMLAHDRADLPAALRLYEQALAIRRKVFSGEHPRIVTALSSVAQLRTLNGDAAGALKIAEEAAAMADRVYTEPSNRHAAAWALLAQVRAANGDLIGAGFAVQRGEFLLEQVSEPPPSTVELFANTRKLLCGQPGAPVSVCAAKNS